MKNDLGARLNLYLERTNELSGGAVGIVHRAVQSFTTARAAEAAASLAYFAFFSLFPFMLLMITLGSYFLESSAVLTQIIFYVRRLIPASAEWIQRNLEAVLETRQTFGILGLIGMIWAGTNVFTVLSIHINRAFTGFPPRSYLSSRLVGLIMGFVIVLAFFLALFGVASLSLIPVIRVPVIPATGSDQVQIWGVFSTLIGWLFIFIFLVAMYRFVPTVSPFWRAVLLAAFVTSVVIRLSSWLFGWYLNSGLIHYEFIYGSLGAIVSMMIWIYLSSWITLFGAHLTSSIHLYLKTNATG